MKTLHKVFLFLIAICFCNCSHPRKEDTADLDTLKKIIDTTIAKVRVESEKDSLISDTSKLLKLKYGFVIKGRTRYGAGKFKSFQFMEIYHNDMKIYTDTSDTAAGYSFDKKLYPILNQLKPGIFELLLQFDNNPSKDLVNVFRIENDKVVKKGTIPTFDGKAELVDNLSTYHGTWDFGEVWDENRKTYTVYNPSIYYQFTADGIKLDTALTIQKNKEIYGRFEGFQYNDRIGYPYNNGKITDTTAKNVLRKKADY